MFDRIDAETSAQWRCLLAGAPLPEDPADLIDLIRGLEDLKSCASSVQARASARLDEIRREEEAEQGVPLRQQGRGVGAEVALARRDSPRRGRQLVGLAKALVQEMPGTLDLLSCGRLNEWRALLAVRETACLTVQDRAAIDSELTAKLMAEPELSERNLVGWIRRRAYAKDPHSVVRRAAHAETERRVTLRPAPDTMTWFSALLPVKQGVAIFSTLSQAADGAHAVGDQRTRGQVMADLLTERVTGAPASMPAAVELTVEITDRALFDASNEPAYVGGYGWVPPGWVRRLLDDADDESRVAIRRLFRPPGRSICLESDSRHMTAGMRRIILLRDKTCRSPWCDAPIRHADHVVSVHDGGATSLANGQGLCEACNYAKQAPGWSAHADYDSSGRHVVETTTPTGHTYRSNSPPAASDA